MAARVGASGCLGIVGYDLIPSMNRSEKTHVGGKQNQWLSFNEWENKQL